MADLQPGTMFAGCRIEGVAGRGGMGVVYRAMDPALGRRVAIKVIGPGRAGDREFRERFAREARMAARIDHPNIVPVYQAGEYDGRPFLVMRHVDGTDLQHELSRLGPLTPARAASVLAQLASALDAAHAAGLVHRDVKPANVLLSEDHVYLTDFGLTRLAAADTSVTETGQWMGTVDYASPEQLRGEHCDARADVYALGCVLFAALTGGPPFPRGTVPSTLLAHLHEPPPRVSGIAGIPAAFDRVIGRALAKAPEHRYPSAGDLARAALAAVHDEYVTESERSVARGPAAPSGEEPTAVSALPGAGPAPAERNGAGSRDPAGPGAIPAGEEARRRPESDAATLLDAPPRPRRDPDAATLLDAPSRPPQDSDAATLLDAPGPAARRVAPPNGAAARGAADPAAVTRLDAPRSSAGPGAATPLDEPPGRDGARDGLPPRHAARRRLRRPGRRIALAILCAFAAALATGLVVRGAGDPPATGPVDEGEVRALLDRFSTAFDRKDSAALGRTLSRTAIRVTPGDRQEGRAAVAGEYRRQFDGNAFEDYELSDVAVEGGGVGRAEASYRVTRTDRPPITGRIVFDVVREGGRPRIALVAATPD